MYKRQIDHAAPKRTSTAAAATTSDVTSCGTGRAVHDSFTAPATPAIACVSDAATYEPPLVSASVVSVDSSSAVATWKPPTLMVVPALDESTLKTLADTTGGSYVAASDTQAIAGVAGAVKLSWTARPVPHEVTSLVVATAAVLVLFGAAWSIVRTGRVI